MSTDEWSELWASGRRGFHQEEVHPLLQSHSDWLLEDGGRVLVPLCGKSVDLCWLARNHPVIGVEAVTQAIEEFLAEQQLECSPESLGSFQRWSMRGLTVLQGDFFELTPALSGPLCSVWDRAALVAIRSPRRPAYVEKLAELLGSRGRILLVGWDADRSVDVGPPYRLTREEVHRLFDPLARVECVHSVRQTPETDERVAAKGLDWVQLEAYRITLR
jgi:thiopurine S-methyltransferase